VAKLLLDISGWSSQYRPFVIDCVNLLGKNEPSILTFTNRHGQDIGDPAQDFEPRADEDDDSFVAHPNDELPGVDVQSGDAELPGVDTDFDAEPTGVEVDTEAYGDVPQEQNKVYGLRQQDPIRAPTETPSVEPTTVPIGSSSPAKRRSTRMAKKPSAYTPSMTGNKYAVDLTQIVASLRGSKNALSMAQMSVKLILPGVHRKSNTVGMIMAQLSMKASIKKWGAEAEYAINKDMKQLPWRDLYKPKHWHGLTKKQKKQVLESHIFVEQKRDGKIKAQKVIGGNKQCDYITKEDVRTVSAEAVMLTFIIDAVEDRDIAVVDIPNAFAQTVVSEEDSEHRVIVRIRGPLFDILVLIAPDVYGPYVSTNKSGQKVLIVECLNAEYGTMVAALLYYKKFVKSLTTKGFKLNPYHGCAANKTVNGKQITICVHVDDCKISHASIKVVDESIDWLQAKYESIFEDGSGEMKVHRGKVHKYLGMSLDFSHKGQCCVTIYDYLDVILEVFDEAVKKHGEGYITVKKRHCVKTAAPDNLFIVNKDCKKLCLEAAASFHKIVAKTLYVTK
jgi:hypothetical protein